MAAVVPALRSFHFVPGGKRKFLDKALTSGADCLIIDLEDGVSPGEKESARAEVRKWLETVDFGRQYVCVRMNATDTDMWKLDLAAVVMQRLPHLVMVPKVARGAEMVAISQELDALEQRVGGRKANPIQLLPIVTEVPEALFHLNEIGSAVPARLYGMTWGGEDLSAALGATNPRDDKGEYTDIYKHARTMTLLAAKTARVAAIDGVYVDLKDMKGLGTEIKAGARDGFDGKMTIHPDQIASVNDGFTPTAKDLAEAKEIVAAFAASPQSGAISFKGKMLDLPHLRRAEKQIAKGQLAESMKDPSITKSKASSGSSSAQSGPKRDSKVPTHGKWFEELTEGLVIYHGRTRTITEVDNILFTTLSLNPAQPHLDYEAAKSSEYGQVLVNSMFTLPLLIGITVLETTHGTTIANLGFEEVTFPKPVFYGDTLRAETTVLKSRETKSRPGQGITKFEHRAYNQRDELVIKAVRNALMWKRPANL